MRRSVYSWHTALERLPKPASPAIKKLKAKIEAATHDQPLSEMIEIDVTSVEAQLVTEAIKRSVDEHAAERATTTVGQS